MNRPDIPDSSWKLPTADEIRVANGEPTRFELVAIRHNAEQRAGSGRRADPEDAGNRALFNAGRAWSSCCRGGAVSDERELELRDASLIAESFLRHYPQVFKLFGWDVVTLMVEGYVFRRVILSLEQGNEQDPSVLKRLSCDVFNRANHLSAIPAPGERGR